MSEPVFQSLKKRKNSGYQVRGKASWDDKKILFVTGKGGVGKSLVAAGIAREQIKRGRKVLLVEVGETSYYKDFWNLPEVGHEPRPTAMGFDLALWSGESCLREYVLYYLKVERLYKLFFDNKVMRSLINVAPGLSELAILGKITSGIRKIGPPLEYDLIVVDTFATGHALALFRAPKGMQEAIKFGPMGHHSRDIRAVLSNAGQTSYLLATLLEELPVVETLELRDALVSELGVEPDIVCNKVLPNLVGSAELARLQEAEVPGGLKEFTSYLQTVGERQTRFMKQLRSATHHLYRIPLIFSAEPDELVENAAIALSEADTKGK